MRLIGLHGGLHSGKDTAYTFLSETFKELSFKRVAFADKLKISSMRALGFGGADDELIEEANWIKEHATLSLKNKYGDRLREITGREYLQFNGAEGHRDLFGEDFWVDALLPKPWSCQYENVWLLHSKFPNIDVLVVTDVRFPNEAKRILALGGKIWYINASSRLSSKDVHSSEQTLPMDLVSVVIDNNLTLDQFRINLVKAWNL